MQQSAPAEWKEDRERPVEQAVGDRVGKLTVAEAIAEFGKAAKAKLSNPSSTGQPEDQLRNPLEQLFKDLTIALGREPGSVVLVGETSIADLKTRPDFSVSVGSGSFKPLVGFIEVKAPGKGFDPRKFKDEHDKAQWTKLKALPNLLYTDGNGFTLWRNGELQGKPVALDGDVETSGGGLAAPATLEPLIADFLGWEPVAPRGARELAETAARLCRFLRDEVVEQMGEGSEALRGLADDWRSLLFPDASDAQFADGYAQAVTFGLLMAKSLKLSLHDELDTVGKKLGQSNTLIGTALRLLTDQPGTLQISLKTMTRVLDVVDWDKVSKGDPEAWLYFYEQFLETYDDKLRKLTGSYYTPPQVVEAMVRLCDEALKSPGRYNIGKGLASEQVHIADPAMGSGTYLLAVMRRIALAIEDEQGPGAVLAAMNQAVKRLYGFELQFGAFAVAQLRLLAEMIEIAKHSLGPDAKIDESALGTPPLFVTDTLGDPYADFESGQGIYKEISRSRVEANKVKREQKITVVIGNPPYKEKAMGRGAWVESGSGNRAALLDDWQPSSDWGVGAHTHKLRNLYVYFWRWAAWKVFQQTVGKDEVSSPQAGSNAGIVCYVTVSGFLNGRGFQKMRSDLRRDCDEIYVVDCSPEGLQPPIATRIFEGVQQPVCIVLASSSPENDPSVPARVLFRSLPVGKRGGKFDALQQISLNAKEWMACPSEFRGPFLPSFQGGWSDFVALEEIITDSGLGVMAGRTWVVAPDQKSLSDRWEHLTTEVDEAIRSGLFHPHLRHGRPGDRHIGKPGQPLHGQTHTQASVEKQIEEHLAKGADGAPLATTPIRYGFRSFDRQWIIPDARLINQPAPKLWKTFGARQVFLTTEMDRCLLGGPGISATSMMPDMHHYGGRGGRVFALWQDSAASQSNVTDAAMKALTKTYGTPPSAEDVFAYVAALLAHPAYTARFKSDLIRPGLRVPLTADKALFAKAAKLGREIVWLHTFGERFADPKADPPRPAAEPRLPVGERPTIPVGGSIPNDPEGFPDTIDYDPVKRQLKVGTGRIDHVPPEVWAYEVSGKHVLRQWFSYRKKNRERPLIGDKRPPSPLQAIQPDHWLPEYTEELLNVLNVLGLLVRLEPEQARLLDEICDGPLITASSVK